MRALLLLALLTSPAMAQDADRGRDLFADRCADCHGDSGQGDGWLAPVLSNHPPDLSQLSARYGGVFPVVTVIWQIDGREPLMPHGGEMPIFGELFNGPSAQVRLEDGYEITTDRAIADIITYLQEIQQ